MPGAAFGLPLHSFHFQKIKICVFESDILHILLADSIIRTAKRFREMKKLQFLKAGMESGVSPAQFISINFEDLNYAYLQTAKALHNEITKRATEINGKAYLSLMKSRK